MWSVKILRRRMKSLEESMIERRYYSNGLPDYFCPRVGRSGWEEKWYINGQKKYELYWKDGREHGMLTFWDRDGCVSSQYYYLDGEEVSEEEYRRYKAITKLAGLED